VSRDQKEKKRSEEQKEKELFLLKAFLTAQKTC